MNEIVVKGAKENNLKNIDITLPKNKLIVMTGVSGSGKSSLAFDTIYQEGQRRFVESLSSFARQFIGNQEKPNVDSIEGLSPAISIDQKSTSHNPRSTVGTVTEIYDYLRLLYSKIGTPYCTLHHEPITSSSQQEMINKVMGLPIQTKLIFLAPVITRSKGEHKTIFEKYLKDGFIRARVDGEIIELDGEIKLDRNKKHDIDIVIERIILKEDSLLRVSEAIEMACKISQGYVKIIAGTEELFFSELYACKFCGYSVPKLEPRLFSFNSPLGACPDCNGLGKKLRITEDLIIDEAKSLNNDAILPYKNQSDDNLERSKIAQTCEFYDIDMDIPFKDLKREHKDIILYGSKDIIKFKLKSANGRNHDNSSVYEGVITSLNRRYLQTTSEWIREWIEGYMVEDECESCHGARLNPMILNIFIADKNINDLCNMSIEQLYDFFCKIKLDPEKTQISDLAIKEIKDRLKFLLNVGLEYLTLSRSAETLSGGEAQRIRLATQIGSRLTGVLYVLDEPSIGLHQRDNAKLINSLKEMRDIGNTLIVVEHDEETMLESDYLVDIGPLAGVHGGEVIAQGTPKEVMKSKDSITAKYLTGEYKIEVPKLRRKGNGKFLEVIEANQNNLKNVSVKFPMGEITCVTGVSGSGKSSLVNEILYKNCYVKLYKSKKVIPGKVKEIKGIENIDRIIQISQSPIGRTPRSNPATYTGVFDDIRELFSQTNDAKIRGFDKGRFSFNVKGGRCEACWGDGVKKISMHFLPDVYVPCEVCKGTRYQLQTLEIKYKGKSIYDVLEMTVSEALDFFQNVPKIRDKVETLDAVGLGYIKLGQSSTTLSGGEAQRVKLAYELHSKISEKTLYILDEPTTGLHTHDIKKLMEVINKICDAKATVVIIEHNLDVIKLADHIIDMGPEGGDKGGTVLFSGTPEDLAKNEKSYTGQYLKKVLNK